MLVVCPGTSAYRARRSDESATARAATLPRIAKDAQICFYQKNCKTLFALGKWKKGIFVNTVCFGNMVLFVLYQSWSTTKNRSFSRHRGKPKIHHLFEKGCFSKGSLKGFLLSVIHKSCALLKTLFCSVLSKTQILQRIGCKQRSVAQNMILTKNSGLCFSMQEGVLNLPFCFFVWSWFQFLGSLCFLARGKRQERNSRAVLEVYSLLYPKKPFLQNPSFLLVCHFCLPFQITSLLFFINILIFVCAVSLFLVCQFLS